MSLAHVYSEPYDVNARLAQMGLSRGPFVQSIREGDLSRRMCTRDSAPSAPGFYLWDKSLEVLGRSTRETHGWHRGSYLRIPVCWDNDERLAIAVASGDHRTGLAGDDPETKSVRGPATQMAVGDNLTLPFGVVNPDDDHGVDFWVYLIRAIDEGLWGELSRPILIGQDGRIQGWAERILLGEVPRDDGRMVVRRPGPAAPVSEAPQIDVPVRRKSA